MQAQPDYMKMTSGEQVEGEGHQKQSVVGKVKNKAKKLTSKIKGVSKKKKNKEAQGHEIPGQGQEHVEGDDTSSGSSSEGEQEEEHGGPQVSQTGPLGISPETREDRPVHGGQTRDESGVDQASRGIAGLNLGGIEAKQDPNVPSYDDEATKRQTIPSAIGQDTAQVSPSLTSGLGGGAAYDRGLGDPESYNRGLKKDSTHDRDTSIEAGAPVSDQSSVKVPESIMKPREEEGFEPREEEGFKPREEEGFNPREEEMKPVDEGVDNSGRDLVSSELLGSGQREEMSRPTESYRDTEQDQGLSDKAKGAITGGIGLGGLAAGTAATEHASHDDQARDQSTDAQQQKGWMQLASESVASVKNVITSKLTSPKASDSSGPTFDKAPEDKTYTESARDTALGAKDYTRDSALGAKDYTRDTALGAKDYTRDTALGAKDATRDTGYAAKDVTADKMGSAAETGKSWTEQAKQAVLSAKDTVASKLPSSTGPQDVSSTGPQDVSTQGTTATGETKPITTRAAETATGLKDAVASKLGYGSTPATGQTGTEHYTGSQPATTDATTGAPTGGPTVTEKVMGTVTGVKDTLASKLGYGGNTGTTGTTAGTDTTTGTEGAKRFHPDEHDTALSQKITDMLSLGGGSKTSSSPATTTTSSSPVTTTSTVESTPRTTDEASVGSPTQGKGYMDRVTGVVGSLLGKKPADATTGTTDNDATVTQQ